nr:DNA gyrase subunit A [Bacteroidales bacterium]
GYVMMKYHPHGDDPIYESMVRMAQDFSLRYLMIDGQGNFGSIDGDNAAAMRYTEARLTLAASYMLEGIYEEAVDFQKTYNNETEEPLVLPAKFPNLLANGATGIAVGMATNIPPHNVEEICEALQLLLKNPIISINDLLKVMPGPDFPTGGLLVEPHENILKAYETGRGSFRLRSRFEVESLKGGAYQIIVTELPYQVQKARLIEKIAELILEKKIPLLGDLRDESAEDIRLVLIPKNRSVDPLILMEALYRQTDLEIRFNMNMNVLDEGRIPKVMSLKEVLQAFLNHRRQVLQRRSNYRIIQIDHRLEVLKGYQIAYLNLDEVIRIIREDDDPKGAMQQRWALSDTQVEAILNMRLRALRKLEEIEIIKELQSLEAEKLKLQELISTEKQQWAVIAKEIKDIQKAFGSSHLFGKRRTTFETAP